VFLARIIPILLLKNKGLVKTRKFKKPRYIGDPINAVRIFNDLRADELIFLDILATPENRTINKELVKTIADEAFMPFAAGGGIKKLIDMEHLLKAGSEKIILNTAAFNNPELIKEASDNFGSQSIIVSIDVKKKLFEKYSVVVKCGSVDTKVNPVEYARRVEEYGAGEILINSIDQDGEMSGYDLKLIRSVTSVCSIPVIAAGGAGKLSHLREAIVEADAHSAAAGSMFVYHGALNAVLLNYPSKSEIISLINN